MVQIQLTFSVWSTMRWFSSRNPSRRTDRVRWSPSSPIAWPKPQWIDFADAANSHKTTQKLHQSIQYYTKYNLNIWNITFLVDIPRKLRKQKTEWIEFLSGKTKEKHMYNPKGKNYQLTAIAVILCPKLPFLDRVE